MIFKKKNELYQTEPGVEYFTVYADMIDNTGHMLIGGTTGSGKSVLINALVSTAILNHTPTEANFIFIDPKRIELDLYRGLPHTIGYADTTDGIIRALDRASDIMESRFAEMKRQGIRTYVGKKIFVVVDELGDLLTNPAHTPQQHRHIVGTFQHIMQLGRAAKVFIIAATQSPSRQTIPAALRLNFTDFVALRCASAIEARQVIGESGAEKLPIYGHALYRTPNYTTVQKVKINKYSDEWIGDRCAYWMTKDCRTN